MKNLLIENLKAKIEAEKTAAEEERLNNLPQADLKDDMKAVTKNKLNVIEIDDMPVGGSNGEIWSIVNGTPVYAKTTDELENTKRRMEQGIHGDGYLYQTLVINGYTFVCKGKTEAALAADVKAAHEFAAQHKHTSLMQATITATTLVGAGVKPEDVEEVEIEGQPCYILYNNNVVIDQNFEVLGDLSDFNSALSKQECRTILVERATAELMCRFAEEEWDDEEEDW